MAERERSGMQTAARTHARTHAHTHTTTTTATTTTNPTPKQPLIVMNEQRCHAHRPLSCILMVIFLFTCCVVLLNILIAQLSDTYQNVQRDAQRGLELNRAWIIARVELNSLFIGKVIFLYLPLLLAWLFLFPHLLPSLARLFPYLPPSLAWLSRP